MSSASHAGLDAKVARWVAADRPGLAHCVSTLDVVDRDALGPAVDLQAGGASGAPDRSTSDCVPRTEIDRVAVDPGGDQEGQDQSSRERKEDGHVDDVDSLKSC